MLQVKIQLFKLNFGRLSTRIIKGNIISDGNSEIISRGFKYGTAVDNLENTVLVGMGIGEYTTSLTELTVATTYYYCAFASNNAETATGEVLNFTTEDISLPTILTLDASNVGVTLATLNARITDDGGSAITSCGFYYGLTPDNLEYQSVYDAVNNDFSKVVNVNMYTTYYCKAYATNAAGTAVGNLVTFTTLNNWVDLGLPSGTCWATCNVGANNPEEYGNKKGDFITICSTTNPEVVYSFYAISKIGAVANVIAPFYTPEYKRQVCDVSEVRERL